MQEWVTFLSNDRDSQMQLGYIFCCCLALLVVWIVPRKRMRGADEPVAGRHDGDAHHDRSLLPGFLRNIDGPGLGAMIHMLVIVGTATAGLIGWRIPAEIERIYGDGAGFGLIFPNVTMPTIGKAAQVIGAFTFALIALRLLRLIVPLMSVILIVLTVVLATEYVFDLQIISRI